MTTLQLPDIQRTAPAHALAINGVGIRGLRYPATLSIDGAAQPVVATFSLSVSLDASERGTHMSRFVEELVEGDRLLSPASMLASVNSLSRRLESPHARIEARFPFFLERLAPASRIAALVDYDGFITAASRPDGPIVQAGVRVPITSLCPCSKEISDYGAHSQRGYVTIEVAMRAQGPMGASLVGLEPLVAVAESAASAQIYSLLKRDDERHVTMAAYDRPAFVEDVVRGIAAGLAEMGGIDAFRVDVDNQESIHNHSAWAMIEGGDAALLSAG